MCSLDIRKAPLLLLGLHEVLFGHQSHSLFVRSALEARCYWYVIIEKPAKLIKTVLMEFDRKIMVCFDFDVNAVEVAWIS